jgi:hypothetical protein
MAAIQGAGPFSPSPLAKSGFARIVLETNATRIGLHGVDFRSSFLKPIKAMANDCGAAVSGTHALSISCSFGAQMEVGAIILQTSNFKLTVTEVVKKIYWRLIFFCQTILFDW